jgi:3-phosphoglycerate kinase
MKLISKLLEKVDTLLLGGAIIFTFYKANGLEVGKSLVDDSAIGLAKQLMANKKIILPSDIVVANEISDKAKTHTVRFNEIPKEYIGLDIGKETIDNYKNILKDAKTIIWNGPMGKFEIRKFGKGTHELAKFISRLGAESIVGGGDTANAIQGFGLEDMFTHVSTGGGASLQLLQGESLPGVVALEENMKKFE